MHHVPCDMSWNTEQHTQQSLSELVTSALVGCGAVEVASILTLILPPLRFALPSLKGFLATPCTGKSTSQSSSGTCFW